MTLGYVTNKSLFFVFLFLLIASVVPACQTQETQSTQLSFSSDDIVGFWNGEAQWMCGRGDPPWRTTLEFRSDGSFAILMTDPNLLTTRENGTWTLSGSKIEIKFPTMVWSGTVSGDKMKGTFKDNGETCTGNWSLTKK